MAPLTKEGTTSVLRPSHHKQPVKRKTAAQVSKAQIQAQIQESATGLTIEGGEDSSGKRKRKRPPQLTEALGGGDGPRSSRRRGDGRIFSPSEFAPINALGQLEVCSTGTVSIGHSLLGGTGYPSDTAWFLCRPRWICRPQEIRRGATPPGRFGSQHKEAQRPGTRRVPSTDRR